MKKNLTTLTLTLLFACFAMQAVGQGTSKGMAFEKEGTLFNQAVQKAKSTGKLIFLDCYTSWCGPCKMMANTVFPQEVVGNFMNPKYVCIKIDMEKGEGPELAKKLQISAYPTFIVFNSAGQEIGRFLGGCKAEEFIEKVKKASEDNTSAEMDKRFADGERDEAFLYSYLNTLSSAYKRDQCNVVAEALLEGKAETFAGDKQLANVFMRHLTNPFCPAFVYTAKHPEALAESMGDTPVRMKIRNVWSGYAREIITEAGGTATLDQEKMDKWLALMDECGVDKEEKEELRLTTLMTYYEKKPDWNAYMECVTDYGTLFDITDLMLCKWCTPVAKICKEEAPKKAAIALLQQRVDDLDSGRRAPQTKQGNMMLSGNMKKAMEMLIDALNGKEVKM